MKKLNTTENPNSNAYFLSNLKIGQIFEFLSPTGLSCMSDANTFQASSAFPKVAVDSNSGWGRTARRSGAPAVRGQNLPGDPAAVVAREEQRGVGDVLRLAEPARVQRLDEALLALRPVAFPLLAPPGAGQDESGRDSIHRDSERTEFHRHLLGHSNERMLGCAVRLVAARRRSQPRAGRDIDDAPIASLLHVRGHGLAEPEGAVGVGVEDRVPIGLGDALDRAPCLAKGSASRIHEDVEPVFGVYDPLHRRMTCAAVRNVKVVRHGAGFRNAIQTCEIDIRDVDPGAGG